MARHASALDLRGMEQLVLENMTSSIVLYVGS